jgi:hypothetical protein
MNSIMVGTEQHLCVTIVGGCVWGSGLPGAPLDTTGASEPDWTRRLDPLSIRAVQCVREARRQAGLPATCETPNQEGVCVGTAWGAQQTRVRYASRLVSHGISGTNPIDFPDSIDGAPAAHVALQVGLQGPSFTCVGGAECAHTALVTAARQLMFGLAERVHVVVGDLRATRTALVAGSHLRGAAYEQAESLSQASDLVAAFVLENSLPRQGKCVRIQLVGFSGGVGVPASRRAVGVRGLDPTGAASAVQFAGAWLGLTTPMGYTPFACQDEVLADGSRRCSLKSHQWPHLALVRTEN